MMEWYEIVIIFLSICLGFCFSFIAYLVEQINELRIKLAIRNIDRLHKKALAKDKA